MRILAWIVLLFGASLVSCQTPAPVVDNAPVLTCTLDPVLHTTPCFADAASATAFLDRQPGPWTAAKLVLGHFSDAAPQPPAWFMDPSFYGLHDEWYWFRLLNGVSIDGLQEAPMTGQALPDIAAVYTWARSQPKLPYDLRWIETRLYSPHFYDLGFGLCATGPCPRSLGIATLLHLPPDPKRTLPNALWGFSLEYGDRPTSTEIEHFFARIEAMLPTDLAQQLFWIAGPAPYQNALATTMRQSASPVAARIVTLADLIADGEVRGYTQGITAGRLRKVAAGQADSTIFAPTDLVVLADVPTALPPVAGILTALPQTPQAHLNLLAAARGTPNAYASGAFDDKILNGWADLHRAVVWEVQTEALRWKVMTDEQWNTWLNLTAPQPVQVQVADLATATTTVDLTQGDVPTSRQLVPVIGGKCAGLMALASQPSVQTPPGIVCLSVKGYAQHIASFTPLIQALLVAPEFTSDPASRALLLEGFDAYAARHAGDATAMQTWHYFKENLFSGVVGQVLQSGGLRTMIAAKPLDPAYEEEIVANLAARFAPLSPHQALRFRSSSTAEDIEGFNGAGVYISASGFLHPELQASSKDQKRTISQAIRDVWASYWLADAFEERELAHIDHLSGRMAVAVHPRFDDDLESANGVALLAYAQRADGDRVQLTVDVQPGALSVTNPPAGGQNLPEIDRVVQLGDQPPTIERVQLPTTATTTVLTDDELLTMFAVSSTLAKAWLVAKQTALAPEEQPRSLTLDLEFRRVHPGWPLQADNAVLPQRLVWKQVRPLEHVGGLTTADLEGALIPRDVLHAATSASKRACQLPMLDVELIDVWTDQTGPQIAGVGLTNFAVQPFTARVKVTQNGKKQTLSWQQVTVTHPQTTLKHWDALLTAPVGLNWQSLAVDESGAWTLVTNGQTQSGVDAKCAVTALAKSKEAWLRAILNAP